MPAEPAARPREPDSGRAAREKALVLVVETALKVLLFGLLGLATVKFHAMLAQLGIAWWKGLPVTLAFVAAALWAGRGAVRGVGALWKGRSA